MVSAIEERIHFLDDHNNIICSVFRRRWEATKDPEKVTCLRCIKRLKKLRILPPDAPQPMKWCDCPKGTCKKTHGVEECVEAYVQKRIKEAEEDR